MELVELVERQQIQSFITYSKMPLWCCSLNSLLANGSVPFLDGAGFTIASISGENRLYVLRLASGVVNNGTRLSKAEKSQYD